jgi:enamine deaminase RidA (YjgF/YER057c/UK114 family)
VVQPDHFPTPRGYANGVLTHGRTLYTGGQIGWELDGSFKEKEIAGQFGRALDHVVDIVCAAGGRPEYIVSMTIFVTDVQAYRGNATAIGHEWRKRLGKHFPAMALVGVTELVEPNALVEIQAIASLPDDKEMS